MAAVKKPDPNMKGRTLSYDIKPFLKKKHTSDSGYVSFVSDMSGNTALWWQQL